MSFEQLRALWSSILLRRAMPPQRSLILRELAWSIQEADHGELDHQTVRLLNAAIRAAQAMQSKASTSQSKRDTQPKSAHRTSRRIAALPASSRLVRTWRGVRHEVLVLDNGNRFVFRGREYDSLSRIAREITGTHWSGPRFFGLTSRARQRRGDAS